MNPEHIGRYYLYATGLHFAQFVLPMLMRETRKMKLAHRRKPGLPVTRDVVVHEGDGVTLWRRSTQLRIAGRDRRSVVPQIENVFSPARKAMIGVQVTVPPVQLT